MAKIQIVSVNRPDSVWDALISDYVQRATRYAPIKWQALKPVHEADVALAKRKNTKQLLAAVPAGNLIVILDEFGAEWNTKQLAQKLTQWMERYQGVSFLVGGTEGLDREQIQSYPSWALSRLTLPHRLAQLVLAEQLYRAFSLQHNHPYHRA